MNIGMVGLGKMGLNLALNLTSNGISVTGYDLNESSTALAKEKGLKIAANIHELVQSLPQPRILWVMVPAGEATKNVVEELGAELDKADMVVDGGNSFYEDSIANYHILKEKGIYFFDCGTSGGMEGALSGGNFMIGGDEAAFKQLEPVFEKIAQPGGYLYTGKIGSGHYLKMVHNGIEYGMMQAIGEGFDLLAHSPYTYQNDKVAALWNNGSVIRSWLMELAAEAFADDPRLEGIKGTMYSSGEGQWTVEEALKRKVPVPVIATSLMMRYRSLEEDTFAGKVVASLRKGFGGHEVKK